MTDVSADFIAHQPEGDPDIGGRHGRLRAVIRAPHEKPDLALPIRADVEIELLRLFAQGRQSSGPALAASSGTVAALAAPMISIGPVLVWLCLQGAAFVLSHRLAGAFLATQVTPIEAKSWRRMFVIAEAIQGCSWALLVFFISRTLEPAAPPFIVALLFLAGAMNATITAPIPTTVIGALTPMTATILTVLLSAGLREETWPLAALAFGIQLYFTHIARKLHATSLETLSYRAEHDELIADLEQAKATSDLARRRAEEANFAKSRFLASMSHELRTPLNAILGFSEVMKNEMFGAHVVGSYKEYSNDIHASGQHLLVLINEILDLSRIEAGRFELKEEAVPLAVVVEDCRHLLTLRARQRQIKIEAAIEPDMPPLWADDRALRQVALNLLSNAVKFTPRRGEIEIKIGWTSRGGQYFSVRDSGPGIPDDEIPIIMASFGRGSLAQKNAAEGSGLGLPIVKGLVELHGGTFTLRSRVRHGTEVIVIFPPERVMTEPARV